MSIEFPHTICQFCWHKTFTMASAKLNLRELPKELACCDCGLLIRRGIAIRTTRKLACGDSHA